MKKLMFFVLVLLVSATTGYSQDVKEDYDKFKKTSSLRLSSDIDLKITKGTGTTDFEANIIRFVKNSDTTYYFYVVGEGIWETWCGEGLEAIILLDNNETISLISDWGDFKAKTLLWNYWLSYEIKRDQLLLIYNARKVEIKCYLREGSLEASFRKDDKSLLDKYLKNYILKGLV